MSQTQKFPWFVTDNPIYHATGYFVTPGNDGRDTGYWMSPFYENDQRWWRSSCGHADDNGLEKCPVCNENKPDGSQ